jgi:flavin-dependent thymidylate synthase
VPKVYLLNATPDPLGTIAAACMMYEGKVCRNLDDVTDEERKHYWAQVQKTHLKAPLEFVDLHFMVEGVTRAFTHQMVRQRTAVYAQESLRFAVKEGFAAETPYPPSLAALADRAENTDKGLEEDEANKLIAWDEAVKTVEHAYQYLVESGIPAEDARGLLPHQITTRLNYKTNLRNLLDHAGNRLCTQAQFEWRVVFMEIIKAIRSEIGPMTSDNYQDPEPEYRHSWQWTHIAESSVFKPVCYEVGHCPFTADFDRGCTIRGRVEEGKFDEINPAEWMLDPTAARRGG